MTVKKLTDQESINRAGAQSFNHWIDSVVEKRTRKIERIVARAIFPAGDYYEVQISSTAAIKQGIPWTQYAENFIDNLYDMGATTVEIIYDSQDRKGA